MGCTRAWVLAALLWAGCEDLEERAMYLTGPDAFTWESDSRFRIAGNDAMWGQANVFDGERLQLFVKGFPPGTVVTAGTSAATVDDEGDAMVETNVAALLGSIPTESLEQASLEQAHMSVQPPGRDAIRVPLRPLRVYPTEVLLRTKEAPLLFEGESATDGPPRNVIWFPGIGEHAVLGAPAPTLADLDAVAVVERPAGTTRTCSGYVDEQNQPQPDVQVQLKETVVTIHARRTGRALATTRFPPVDECPSWLTVQRGREEVRDSPLPEDAVVAWLTAQLSP
jgi:hypothetical protein